MQFSTSRTRLASNRSRRDAIRRPFLPRAESSSSSLDSSFSRPQQQPLRRPFFRSPPPPPPGWDAQVSRIDAKPLSKLVLALFRSKMVSALEGKDSEEPKGSYEAIVDLTKKLNALAPSETTKRTRTILKSLFPSWLPAAFAVLFSKPLPYLSARINAEATALACEWLMGPTEVNDGGGRSRSETGLSSSSSSSSSSSTSTSTSSSSISISTPPLQGSGFRTGCKVTYCRYLASTGCVSACLNSCKLPTQRFFAEDMGLPLRMSPNLDDFSCQFSFGVSPDLNEDMELLSASSCLCGCSILLLGSGSSKSGGEGEGKCPGSSALRGECGGGGGG